MTEDPGEVVILLNSGHRNYPEHLLAGAANAFGLAASVAAPVAVAMIVGHHGVVPGFLTLALIGGVPAAVIGVSPHNEPDLGADTSVLADQLTRLRKDDRCPA